MNDLQSCPRGGESVAASLHKSEDENTSHKMVEMAMRSGNLSRFDGD